MRRVSCLAVLLVAGLAAASTARAASTAVAEVRGPAGELLATAGLGWFSYPEPLGAAVRVGGAEVDSRGVDLRYVSLLGGRIWAYRVYVPADPEGTAAVESLVVDGRRITVAENQVVHLTPNTYVVVLQRAYVPGRRGRSHGVVGMRVYVGDRGFGVPRGTQLLVGLARPAVRQRPRSAAANALILGLDPALVAANAPIAVASPIPEFRPSLGSRAMAIAVRQLGVPYVWAGADPAVGFDCSGLVMYAYGRVGVPLPHFSGSQFNYGTRIAKEDLAPGDLVFFHQGPLGPGHVGMYVGGGRFVHAPRRGDVVKISSLSEPGYALGYVGAVRPY